MGAVDRQQVRKIFTEAIEQPVEARAGFVARACGGDAALEAEVLSLLGAFSDAGEYLASPTASAAEAATRGLGAASSATDIRVGESIGPYRILELIGEGGFGRVFVAEQTRPLKRRVALKVIKAGMDSRQVLARFEAERQALALMDHPNIATVFDAGSTSPEQGSRPYVVMELVRGIPITQYCDQARLSTAERLELLVPVCQAVQHAHTKGVIHRDIKPGNVLVTMHDGVPVPKVIDFGIAKAISGRLAEATVYTEFRQMIGTPAYMSPEQAEMSGLDVDTRSDVYSLGVLLYELLTGAPPFEPQELYGAALGEMQRILREVDPPKPSTRLSTLGNRAATVASCRRVDADRLRRMLRGDLDWIVMKALEKNRQRRYDSPSALADDVLRHLRHEPVLAGPPGAGYALGKFARRHRAVAAVACAFVAALIMGTGLATVGFIRASRERDAKELQRVAAERSQAEAERALAAEAQARQQESVQRAEAVAQAARAESLLRFSDLMIGCTDPDVSRTIKTTARQILDTAAGRISEYFVGQPGAEFSMRLRVGRAYAAVGEFPRAIRQLSAAAPLMVVASPPPSSQEQFDLWDCLGRCYASLGDPAASSCYNYYARCIGQEMIAAHSPRSRAAIDRLWEAFGVGGLRFDRRVCDPAFEEAVTVLREELRPSDPLRHAAWLELFAAASSVADERLLLGRTLAFDAAINYYRSLEAFSLETWSEGHTRVVTVRQEILDHAWRGYLGGPAELAAAEWQRAATASLGTDHWLPAYVEGLRARVRHAEGCPEGAEAALRKGVEATEAQCGLESLPARTMLAKLLVVVEDAYGRRDEDNVYRDDLATAMAAVGLAPTTDDVMRMIRTDQASLRAAVEDLDTAWPRGGDLAANAAARLLKAREQCALEGTARDRVLARWLTHLVWRWSNSNSRHLDVRRRLIRVATDILRRYGSTDPSAYGWALCWQGHLDLQAGDAEAAERAGRECFDIWEMNRGAAGKRLAESLIAQGRYEEAAPIAEWSVHWLAPRFGIDHVDTRQAIETWWVAVNSTSSKHAPPASGPCDVALSHMALDEKSPGISAEGFTQRASVVLRERERPQHEYELALRVVQRVLGRVPDSRDARIMLGLALIRTGDGPAAVQTLQAIAEEDESRGGRPSVMVHALLAMARAKMGDPAGAAAALRVARDAADSSAPTLVIRKLLLEAGEAVESGDAAGRPGR